MQSVVSVDTPAGEARITWYPAARPRLLIALGHGAGGGIGARDLQALAAELPAHGVSIALVEQPWRVAGKKVAPAPKTLDVAWRAVWPTLLKPGLPVIAGGRSAGARVACRTAAELGAHGVLALSFPLHPGSRLRSNRAGTDGRPQKSRKDELLGAGVSTLVVQGGNDPFGRPGQFPPGTFELAEVPSADHGFAVPKRAAISQEEALKIITDTVAGWTARLGEC